LVNQTRDLFSLTFYLKNARNSDSRYAHLEQGKRWRYAIWSTRHLVNQTRDLFSLTFYLKNARMAMLKFVLSKAGF
jgi:hypothetical protein